MLKTIKASQIIKHPRTLNHLFLKPSNKWDFFKKLLCQAFEDKIITKLSEIQHTIDNNQSLGHLVFNNPVNILETQSVKIRTGQAYEQALSKFANFYGDNIDTLSLRIELQKAVGKKVQLDSLFLFNGIVHSYEIKANLNLDTGKAANAIETLKKVEGCLNNYFGKNNVSTKFLSCRFPTQESITEMSGAIRKIRGSHVIGYIDFFRIFDMDIDEITWDNLAKTMGQITKIKTKSLNYLVR